MFIWVNGQYLDDSQPVIRASDRGFLYGYGLFETVRIYPDRHSFGKPFRLEDHIHRLSHSAKRLNIPLTVSLRSFRKIIARLVKLNNLSSGRLRITLSAGPRDKENSTRQKQVSSTSMKSSQPTCVVEITPVEDYSEAQKIGVKISIAPYRRSVESPLYQHKTLNYLENILFRRHAKRKKIFEFIFTNTWDEVTEGTTTNIFIVRYRRVYTPPISSNILPGITRKIIFGLCTTNGIRVRQRVLKEEDILSADEVFLTNSIIEIVPVIKCADAPTGHFHPSTGQEPLRCSPVRDEIIGRGVPGKITRQLQASYRQLVESYLPES